jgi:hypothetical protein
MHASAEVFVSHHQLQVLGGWEQGDHLGLFVAGGNLLQVTGGSQLTVFTGPHTGRVRVELLSRAAPPDDDIGDWEAASEATMWCPEGRMWVCGLMGDCPEELGGRVDAGLVRVRVAARHRRPEGTPGPQEEYQVSFWPVNVDIGFRDLRDDGYSAGSKPPDPARAAGWAMVRLISLANPDPREENLRRAAARAGRGVPEPPDVRVDVRRHHALPPNLTQALLREPADHLGAVFEGEDWVLPAGPVGIRLRPVSTPDGAQLRWRWQPSRAAVPDDAESTVHLRVDASGGLSLIHTGVCARDAVMLGLVWEHLLDRVEARASGVGVEVHPWVPVLAEMEARAAARQEAARRSREAMEARRWGGRPPTDRLRGLLANTIGLSKLDRGLLDSLADAPPEAQRAVARWATRKVCGLARLDTVDWITPALAAMDRGEPLPPPFDTEKPPWDRLWADPRVPVTTVTIPTGTPNCSQQAIAFPAIHAAYHDDPLAAAVDTVYWAALAYGDRHRDLLAAAAVRLAEVTGSGQS